MGKLVLNHKPSVRVHGLFGYVWFHVELLLNTARLDSRAASGRQ